MAWDIGAAFPYLPDLSFSGGLPGVKATLPELNFAGQVRSMEIAGTLGELSYTNTITGSYFNIRNSYLPELSFSGFLGYETWIDAKFPDLQAAFIAGATLSGSFAALEFDGWLKRELRFNLDKILPELAFSGQTGWPLSGNFPSLEFTGIVTLENRWNVSGKLPQIQYSTDQSIVYSSRIVAKVSPVSFIGEYKVDQIWTLDKDLPALLGSFEIEAQTDFALEQKLAVLEYTGVIIGNPYYDLESILPQLNSSSRITFDVDTDALITTSDGIIRYRRWS